METSAREKGSSISRVMDIIEAVSKAERPLSPADLAVLLTFPNRVFIVCSINWKSDGVVQTNMRGLIVPGCVCTVLLGVCCTASVLARRGGHSRAAHRADSGDLRHCHRHWQRDDLLRSRAVGLASAAQLASRQSHTGLVYRQRQALSQFAAQAAPAERLLAICHCANMHAIQLIDDGRN